MKVSKRERRIEPVNNNSLSTFYFRLDPEVDQYFIVDNDIGKFIFFYFIGA